MVIEKAPTIRVYSKTPCVQCNAVKKNLDKAGATYEVVDVGAPENAADLEALKELGYMNVPVTFVNDHHFYGYDVNELSDAVARQRRAALYVVETAA